MNKFKRITSLETVMKTASDGYLNMEISRIVPQNDQSAYMNVKVHVCDETGNYDPEMKVMEVDGIDTLELQEMLLRVGREIAQMTGVHIIT